MKIAFLVNEFPVLSETFILNQITGLLDLGHEIGIFAQSHPGQVLTHPEVEKYRLPDITHYPPRMPRNKILCLFLALFLIIIYLPRYPIPMMRFIWMFIQRRKDLSLGRLYLLIEFLKERFDIIHCHYGYIGLIGAFIKKQGVKVKVGTVFHGYDISQYLAHHGPDVYGELFQGGDVFLPISDFWGNKLIKLGCDPQKIIVHHMGLDLEKFIYLARSRLPTDAIKLLTIGRLCEKKGQEYTIRATAKLITKYPRIELTIAGDGPLKNDLLGLVRQLQIEKYVTFTGPINQDEIIALYNKAHLFILPSVTAPNGDQEGIPVVLMEAQASGIPVVATRHTGIPEVVLDGQSGFLVPERDVDALAEKIGYLIEHPEIWPRMGRNGREHVEKHFAITLLNQRLVEIYQDLLKKE